MENFQSVIDEILSTYTVNPKDIDEQLKERLFREKLNRIIHHYYKEEDLNKSKNEMIEIITNIVAEHFTENF